MLKRKRRSVVMSVALLVYVGIFLAAGYLSESTALSRTDSEMENKMNQDILSANVILVPWTQSGDSASYGIPASGVIFAKEDNTYYVLTANHTLEIASGNWLVLNYKENPFGFSGGGLRDYYSLFPVAEIEYQNEANDLAILSFQSEEDLTALDFAKSSLLAGDKVAVISTPRGYERNLITYGKVLAVEQQLAIDSDDEQNIYYHNAFIHDGSSGSVVLNANMEIAGINIASAEFLISRKFRKSVAVPVEEIIEVINEWKR